MIDRAFTKTLSISVTPKPRSGNTEKRDMKNTVVLIRHHRHPNVSGGTFLHSVVKTSKNTQTPFIITFIIGDQY